MPRGNVQNLRPINNDAFTKEQRIENARKAGLASAGKKKERKLLADIVKEWARREIRDEKKITLLKSYGIEDLSNKSLLFIQLLRNTEKLQTSSKAIEQLIELLGEDREKEARIKKLELENEKLKKELNGELSDNKILIIGDIPKNDKLEENSQ